MGCFFSVCLKWSECFLTFFVPSCLCGNYLGHKDTKMFLQKKWAVRTTAQRLVNVNQRELIEECCLYFINYIQGFVSMNLHFGPLRLWGSVINSTGHPSFAGSILSSNTFLNRQDFYQS